MPGLRTGQFIRRQITRWRHLRTIKRMNRHDDDVWTFAGVDRVTVYPSDLLVTTLYTTELIQIDRVTAAEAEESRSGPRNLEIIDLARPRGGSQGCYHSARASRDARPNDRGAGEGRQIDYDMADDADAAAGPGSGRGCGRRIRHIRADDSADTYGRPIGPP